MSRRKLVWLIPVLLVVGIGAVILSVPRGFEMPENFPVLSTEEIGAESKPTAGGTELATFGSGCFWCTEAVFAQMKGVQKVVSGYSGGSVSSPTYEQVTRGETGHAEVVQLTFDPGVVSYVELLEVFWRTHNPTTLNRQGSDYGTQYRSVVFTHSESQKRLAALYKRKIDEAGVFPKPVVTEIVPYDVFYPAERYHQNFFADNPRQPYCRNVIEPKVEKLKKVFQDRVKPE